MTALGRYGSQSLDMKDDMKTAKFNPLAAEFFFIPLRGTEIIFCKPSHDTDFFSMFTIWHSLFS